MSEKELVSSAPGAAGIRAIAAAFYGVTLDEARAAAIAADLARLGESMKAAGRAPLDAAPGAQFRRLLLAGDTVGTHRA